MAIKQRPDSPTNNFCTLNPLDMANSPTISDGNLSYIHTTANLWATCRGSLGFNSGRYYWEGRVSGTSANLFGYCDNFNIYANGGDTLPRSTTSNLCVSWYGSVALLDTETGQSYPWSGGGFGDTDVVMICVDYDLGYVWLGKNGTWLLSGDPDNNSNYVHAFSNSEKITIHPFASSSSSTGIYFNFGQDPTFGGIKTPSGGTNSDGSYPDKSATGIGGFFYEPPAGALALCSANLSEMTPTVDDDVPKDYFKAVTYTGTGGGQVDPVLVGFQPDLVWIKNRDTTDYHNIYDSVRTTTVGALYTNDTAGNDGVERITFSSNGFNRSSTVYGFTNSSNEEYIAWSWKAGGAPDLTSSPTKPFAKDGVQYETLSAANITAGTITPTAMSVNTKAGFSIVKYNGNGTSDDVNYSIPHGLSYAPDVVIVKNLDLGTQGTGVSWPVLFTNIGGMPGLDGTLDKDNISGGGDANRELNFNWGGSYPNANTFFVRRPSQSSETNKYRTMGAYNYIAYCWHNVEGFSKFGSYISSDTQNDGNFVYLGFKPAFVILKATGTITGFETYTSWCIYDNARQTANPNRSPLFANHSVPEGYRGNGTTSSGGEGLHLDFLSNGFKIRSENAEFSSSHPDPIIYAAWAEQPFNYANAR